MRALHTALVLETGRVSIPAAVVHAKRLEAEATIKNMVLFLSAPFVGLVYAVLLPFVGLGMLAIFGARAFYKSGYAHRALHACKKMVMYATSPALGLAYLVALPFAGIGMLIWIAARAAMAGAPA